MKDVAELLNRDKRTIYRHFPDLCRQISSRHQQYREKMRQQEIAQSCEEVHRIVQTLHQQGIYPGEVRVSEKMSKPGYFRYPPVRHALQQAKKVL